MEEIESEEDEQAEKNPFRWWNLEPEEKEKEEDGLSQTA